MQGTLKGATGDARECTCALLLLLLALLHDASTTEAAKPSACLVSATGVTGCKTCARVRVNATVTSTVCTGCGTGYAFKRNDRSSGGLCECAAGFGSTVAVPVPTDPRDPNWKQQSDKQKEYAKRYKGKACLQCPDEYATLHNRQLPIRAARCRPCPAVQLPDTRHALCARPPCDHYPCKNGRGTATCRAKAGAPKGRTCTCNAGFAYKNDASGCVDVNACASHPCRNGTGTAACRDLPPPAPDAAAGRNCTCSAGFFYKDDRSGCTARPACDKYPCKNGKGVATCRAKAGAPKGRTCTCTAGFVYKDDASGCLDVDACASHPCRNGTGTAACRDLPPPAPDTAAGRNCTCSAGFFYQDDNNGCTDDGATYLRVNTHRVVVGFAVRLIFTARFARDTTGATIQLYQSAQPGALTNLISPLVDDGLFSHRDDASGDMVFSNTFTATYEVPETIYFAATNSNDELAAPVTAMIAVVVGPEPSHREAGLAYAQQLQAQLDSQIANGTARADALNNIKEALLALRTIAPPDIIVSGRTVRWTTAEGLRFVVQAYSDCERSGGRGRGLLGEDSALGTPYAPAAAAAAALGAGTCPSKGKALVLAPYLTSFGSCGGDEAEDIASILQAAGYTVTFKCDNATKCPDGGVSVEDLKPLWRYAVVAVSTHGDSADDGSSPVIATGQQYTEVYQSDWDAGYVEVLADGSMVLRVLPFFDAYASQMGGAIVYMSACRSARGQELARNFLSQGAVSFVGYTDYAAASFCKPRAISTFNHLASGGTVGQYPANGDAETDSDPAQFRATNSDANATLREKCNPVAATDLVIQYTWPASQQNLDTGTTFYGQQVGKDCYGRQYYMTWSGDDTSAGGSERVTVYLMMALASGHLSNGTVVHLVADWYGPAAGSGLATATVSLRNNPNGQLYGSQQLSIAPGIRQANMCASTRVGTVTLFLGEPAPYETPPVSFLASAAT